MNTFTKIVHNIRTRFSFFIAGICIAIFGVIAPRLTAEALDDMEWT